jgi:hypothetical protein
MLTGTLLWFDGVEPMRCDDSPQKGGWGLVTSFMMDDLMTGGEVEASSYTGFFWTTCCRSKYSGWTTDLPIWRTGMCDLCIGCYVCVDRAI